MAHLWQTIGEVWRYIPIPGSALLFTIFLIRDFRKGSKLAAQQAINDPLSKDFSPDKIELSK